MREVERTGDKIKSYLNGYLNIHIKEMRKTMKTSSIKINHVLHIENKQEGVTI
jgi:hypothetical protein